MESADEWSQSRPSGTQHMHPILVRKWSLLFHFLFTSRQAWLKKETELVNNDDCMKHDSVTSSGEMKLKLQTPPPTIICYYNCA